MGDRRGILLNTRLNRQDRYCDSICTPAILVCIRASPLLHKPKDCLFAPSTTCQPRFVVGQYLIGSSGCEVRLSSLALKSPLPDFQAYSVIFIPLKGLGGKERLP